jgi:hypothetical protein
MRKCYTCSLEKDDNDFYKASRNRGLMPYCKDCLKARVKERGRNNKKKAVALMGGKCSRCGYSRCISALEFHHTNPENKESELHDIRFCGWKIFWFEVSKCILLCANCHREEEERLLI